MAEFKKMSTATASGSRLEQLKTLAMILAKQIDLLQNGSGVEESKTLPQLIKQYRETTKEIEEIEGADKGDEEIDEILSERKADGKSRAVR